MIKLGIGGWGDYPRLPGCDQCNHWVFTKEREADRSESERYLKMYAADFAVGGKVYELRNAGSL